VAKKSTDASDHLFFGERLKSDSAWDHTVKTKLNNVFFILVTFLEFF